MHLHLGFRSFLLYILTFTLGLFLINMMEFNMLEIKY